MNSQVRSILRSTVHFPSSINPYPPEKGNKSVRALFGQMALLDTEPTHLFRIDQAPFYDLMAERPEVATGIIRVLTGHLRYRIRDIAQLNGRVKELEIQGPA
jgi:hypothetical protein